MSDDLSISAVKNKLSKTIQIFKMIAILRSQQTFSSEALPEFEYAKKITISIADILNVWSTL